MKINIFWGMKIFVDIYMGSPPNWTILGVLRSMYRTEIIKGMLIFQVIFDLPDISFRINSRCWGPNLCS